jgi:hypothetical protein
MLNIYGVFKLPILINKLACLYLVDSNTSNIYLITELYFKPVEVQSSPPWLVREMWELRFCCNYNNSHKA